jgi:hypothetical protein
MVIVAGSVASKSPSCGISTSSRGPHIDCVESFLDYRVPVDTLTPLAEYDGSVVCERTAGEVSARCHDEQANFLTLNRMHDIVTGAKSVSEARDYYAKEFRGGQGGSPGSCRLPRVSEPASGPAIPTPIRSQPIRRGQRSESD